MRSKSYCVQVHSSIAEKTRFEEENMMRVSLNKADKKKVPGSDVDTNSALLFVTEQENVWIVFGCGVGEPHPMGARGR